LPRFCSPPPCDWSRRLHVVWAAVITRLRVAWRELRDQQPLTRVEVLATDSKERRRLTREIRTALRRLERVAGPTLSCPSAVLVQRTVRGTHGLAGCSLITRNTDGRRFTLIRLATQVDGRPLTLDEILAVLAELWVGVAADQLAMPVVLVPCELGAAADSPPPLDVLPSDPLVPRTNGHISHRPDQAI
jgi:hypothetical protein